MPGTHIRAEILASVVTNVRVLQLLQPPMKIFRSPLSDSSKRVSQALQPTSDFNDASI